MKAHIHSLKQNITSNKSTWLMGVINVVMAGLVANGGIDISNTKNEISTNKDEIIAIHKRITSRENEDAAQAAQIKWLKEDVDKLSLRIDRLTRK